MEHMVKKSGKNTIECDLRYSANPLSYGQLRNSAASHYAQVSGELNRRSCTSQWYSPPVGTPDRHSTKSAIDHDDNVQRSLDVSQCQTSDVQITNDVSHDHCTNEDVTHETGFRKLETNGDASQSPKILSRSNTPEGKTYCGDEFVKYSVMNGKNIGTANIFICPFDCDFFNEKEDIYLLHLKADHGFEKKSHVQEKELCNQCEFTCETKGELEKHTSVEHENSVQSGHVDGTDKNNTPVEDIQKVFLCPFNCDFQMRMKTFFLYIWLKIMDFQSDLLMGQVRSMPSLYIQL